MKEIERLKAGIADAERWAAHSAAGEAAAIGVIKRAVSDMLRIPVSIEALAVSAIRQSLSDFRPSVAGSRMLERLRAIEGERDALLAEVERLRARRAEMCECVNHGEINANYTDDDCPKCGGSGGVVVEGDK